MTPFDDTPEDPLVRQEEDAAAAAAGASAHGAAGYAPHTRRKLRHRSALALEEGREHHFRDGPADAVRGADALQAELQVLRVLRHHAQEGARPPPHGVRP